MGDKYILDGHKIVPCNDLLEWAKWIEKAERHVADDKKNDIRVSTVFLGVDYSFGQGPPLLFETMIFGGEHDGDMDRYSTWEEAEEGHRRMVAKCHGAKGICCFGRRLIMFKKFIYFFAVNIKRMLYGTYKFITVFFLDFRDFFFMILLQRVHFRKDIVELFVSIIERNKSSDVMIRTYNYHKNNTSNNVTPEGRS